MKDETSDQSVVSTHYVSVVQALPEGNIGLQVDDDGEVEEDEAHHQVLVDGEAGAAQGPEGAEDVEAEEEGEETDDGETEVGVGHYDGQVASVPHEVDVGETLGVVGCSAPVSSCLALQPGQAGVAGAAQVRDQRAGDGGQGARGGGRPAQDTVVVPPAPSCGHQYHYYSLLTHNQHRKSSPVGINYSYISQVHIINIKQG